MKTVVIDNFDKLHKELKSYKDDKMWIFRGQSDVKWQLIPKAGRNPFNKVDDKKVFTSWKRQAIEYIPKRPQTDWEWLAIAQHHGLATRLLDWSTNPLNACFFAIWENTESDAVVYAARFKWTVAKETTDPMSFKNVATFRPNRVVPRITRQGGLFTIHPKPKEALDDMHSNVTAIHRLIIPLDYRATLQSELSYYGISAASLFPDLDGLSRFINWAIEKREYWQD